MHRLPGNMVTTSFWLHLPLLSLLLCLPAYGAEPIDGFRDLKFGMSLQEVQTLNNCSTSRECIYELSQKNRYLQLTYDPDRAPQESSSTKQPKLTKITIDMGQHTDSWYKQLQMILGSSYRLTHDFTNETQRAFLENQLPELQLGYENGQILLAVIRRQYGNMILNIVYQDISQAAEFIEGRPSSPTHTP